MSRIQTGSVIPLAPLQYGTSQDDTKTKDRATTRCLSYQSEVVELYLLLLRLQGMSHPVMKRRKRPYTLHMNICVGVAILELTPFLEAPRQDHSRREGAYL